MATLNPLNWLRSQRQASTTAGRIEPRKVEFDWSDTPVDWIPEHPFASYFINQINMILPEGEFWFCRLYNQALPLVTDDKLRQDVQAFIRQEAMHARAHASANERYLKERQVDVSPNLAKMKWLFTELLADKPMGRTVPKALQRRWLLTRLGLIATIEHMTCVLGSYALQNKQWDQAGADEELLDLLRWHGAEEIEHRSVAFDLYQHLGGDYLSRYYLSLIVVPMVIGLWVDGAATLMKQDERFKARRPSVFRPWMWLEWARVSKSGMLPHPVWLALQQLPFFSPWYDPAKEGDSQAALDYLKQSVAAVRAAGKPMQAYRQAA